MGRTNALFTLAILALPLSVTAARAGPPERPTGKMARDDVAEGLLRYRKATDPERRRALLRQLAPTGDPRVAVALGDALASDGFPYPEVALLAEFFLPPEKRGSTDSVWDWWRDNEADLRRRAERLP
jgi:hypothetical protein